MSLIMSVQYISLYGLNIPVYENDKTTIHRIPYHMYLQLDWLKKKFNRKRLTHHIYYKV